MIFFPTLIPCEDKFFKAILRNLECFAMAKKGLVMRLLCQNHNSKPSGNNSNKSDFLLNISSCGILKKKIFARVQWSIDVGFVLCSKGRGKWLQKARLWVKRSTGSCLQCFFTQRKRTWAIGYYLAIYRIWPSSVNSCIYLHIMCPYMFNLHDLPTLYIRTLWEKNICNVKFLRYKRLIQGIALFWPDMCKIPSYV